MKPGFVGAGLGAACVGMRPIVELMYMDFALVAADQIINQVAKTRYVFGGKARIPLVIRGQQGVGRGNAATHSQSVEALFVHFPGLKVVMPSTADDATGLLRTAIRDDNPVIFIEHKQLYVVKGEVNDDPDYCIPFGQAKVVREGKDVTVVGTHTYVQKAVNVAERLEKEGISVEVIDPRTIVPLDMDTIEASVKKTAAQSSCTKRTRSAASAQRSALRSRSAASSIWMRLSSVWAQKPARCRLTSALKTPLCPRSRIFTTRSREHFTNKEAI